MAGERYNEEFKIADVKQVTEVPRSLALIFCISRVSALQSFF
jgi:hypothetical protein